MGTRTRLDTVFPVDRPHPDGVVGLVDDLLAYCHEAGVRLTGRPGRMTAEPLAGGPGDEVAFGGRGSVFRALLARLAALCNDQRPDSVSPYGGQGEFVRGAPSGARFRVSFRNTPDDQCLELTPLEGD